MCLAAGPGASVPAVLTLSRMQLKVEAGIHIVWDEPRGEQEIFNFKILVRFQVSLQLTSISSAQLKIMMKCQLKAKSLNQWPKLRIPEQQATQFSEFFFPPYLSLGRGNTEMMGTEWLLLVCTQNCFEQAMIRCEKQSFPVEKHVGWGRCALLFLFSCSSATRRQC